MVQSTSSFEKIFDTSRDALINRDYCCISPPSRVYYLAGLSKMEAAFPEGTKFSTFVVDGNSFSKSEMIVSVRLRSFVDFTG